MKVAWLYNTNIPHAPTSIFSNDYSIATEPMLQESVTATDYSTTIISTNTIATTDIDDNRSR
jgi:hypothetical protein